MNGGLPRLQELWLSNNMLRDEGAQALAAGLGSFSLPSLTELRLNGIFMGDDGACALAGGMPPGLFPTKQIAKIRIHWLKLG